MLTNLAAVAANYRQAGIRRFVLAWFVRDASELQAVRDAAVLPLRVARLVVPLADIEHRLASDVTAGRRDDLRAAAELMMFLRWLPGGRTSGKASAFQRDVPAVD